MRTHFTLVFLCILFVSNAQVRDNFDDSDLNLQPAWVGQLNNFTTDKGELRSNCSLINSNFYLSTPSALAVNCEWSIDTRLLLNTSSLNSIDIVLVADSMNLLKMSNGYLVRMGGTTDEVSLYKVKNGVETKLIDGADNVLNTSNNQWKIIVKHLGNGIFILERQPLAGGPIFTEGSALDTSVRGSGYLGIRIKQSTASFFNKHFFDNLYCGKILTDTLAPVLDSLKLTSAKQLYAVFNEACDSSMLMDTLNYSVNPGTIHPWFITVNHLREVTLNFKYPFVSNIPLVLNISSIADTSGNLTKPIAIPFIYSKPDTATYRQLLITELMPDPSPVVGLPDKEYVEITNHSGRYIQLNGCTINDPTGSKKLPDRVLAPDSIVVLYSLPSLNNAADRIWIENQYGQIIHSVNYTDQWYKDSKKQDGGWSLEMIDMDNLCAGEVNWMASINKKGGTPGFMNSVKGLGIIDKTAPQFISVRTFNDSTIGILFNEEIDSLNSNNFSFYKYGKRHAFSWLGRSPDFKEIYYRVDFVPETDSLYDFILSGIRDCSGNTCNNQKFRLQWPSMSLKSELIFNEILFNPKSGGYDFIELYNNSSKAFDLNKHFIAVLDETNQYKSIDRISANQLIVQPYQYVLISENTAKICSSYQCNNPDALRVNFSKMPSMPDDEGNLLLVNMNGKLVDSLYYSAGWHFPLLSDKEGVSLERVSFKNSARDIYNWHSAASVVGFATPGYLNSQSVSTKPSETFFSLQNKTVSPDEDGFEDVLVLNYKLPKQDFATTITIYDTDGRLIQQWINNETLGTEGFLTWNGTDYNSQKAAIGIYILQIECTHPSGEQIREKMSCVVAGKF